MFHLLVEHTLQIKHKLTFHDEMQSNHPVKILALKFAESFLY